MAALEGLTNANAAATRRGISLSELFGTTPASTTA
jgi:hypothetical protein